MTGSSRPRDGDRAAARQHSVGAAQFVRSAGFLWHQRFRLAGGVYTPGANDIESHWQRAGLPDDLSGKTVIDIGTTNGGAAFECERRGAKRVVAVDIYPSDHFGFSSLRDFLSSQVEFIQGSVYELPVLLKDRFDIILFWGVLYHLRHPLLALDSLRELSAGPATLISIESAVADGYVAEASRETVLFFRREMLADASNWFVPSVAALLDWCESSGLEAELMGAWPDRATRCMVRAKLAQGQPEYMRISYEKPLHVIQNR